MAEYLIYYNQYLAEWFIFEVIENEYIVVDSFDNLDECIASYFSLIS